MRLNRALATQPGLSRRAADDMIAVGRVQVNGVTAVVGQQVEPRDIVTIDGRTIEQPPSRRLVMLHKPVGYVCSRRGQGAPTVYELLPPELRGLKSIGRLDKDSSGLLLLTNDGELAQTLSHPSAGKEKTYEVTLTRPLDAADRQRLHQGVPLPDGPSRLGISGEGSQLTVLMTEGRNRQIRRTFAVLGYKVTRLHRVALGPYHLANLATGQWREVKESS